MAYALGIDVGTTFSAAAIWRDDRVELIALGTHRVIVPTVMFADRDDLLFGASAVARGHSKPVGAAREFKRRLGDSVPLVLSGSSYSADRLFALFARWMVDTVVEQLAESPEHVVVTHPANWTDFQLNLVVQALREVGLDDVEFLSEPEAAAFDYTTSSTVAAGELVLVYDLGGGTFDVALLRRQENRFTPVGEAAGVERLGGIDFDEAVFRHVVGNLPAASIETASADATGRMALAQLRRACVEAKEELSTAFAADVAVVLPGHASTVRLTRPDFEDMIRPMLGQTVELVRRVMADAGVETKDLSAILLIGGASRSPLVAELVGHTLDATVRIDAHPKLVVARGAARWAGRAVRQPDDVAPTGPSNRKWWLVGAGTLALGVVAAAAFWARAPNDDPTATPMTVSHVEPIGVASIAPDVTFADTAVGGLSGIAYDPAEDSYYAISDDLVRPRYYELAVDVGDGRLSDGDVSVIGVTLLRDQLGALWPTGTLEADAVALSDDGTLFVADEGNLEELRMPAIYQFDLDGSLQSATPAPTWYQPTQANSSGMQDEGGFSSLAFVGGQSPSLVAATEKPLKQDVGTTVGAPLSSRLLVYDAAGSALRSEFGYPLANVPSSTAPGGLAPNRLVELLAIDAAGTFLALELNPGGAAGTSQLHETTLVQSPDQQPAFETPRSATKRMVVDFGDAGLPVGEFQGIALGPALPDGRRVLIAVLDNGLEDDFETQFVAFAVELEPATG